MKKTLILSLSLGALFLLAATTASQAEGKQVTLKGEGQCAKCGLKQADSCQNTITVEKGGKKTVYFLEQNDVSKKFHKNVCQAAKQVEATGTVKEEGGKHILVASKVAVVEK
jgi:hypothetical protein